MAKADRNGAECMNDQKQDEGDEVERRAIEAFQFLRQYVGVLTFFATVAGVIFFGLQFSAMNQQVEEMRKQSKTAQQQVTIQRQQTVYAERAWIGATDLAISRPLEWKDGVPRFAIKFVLTNIGHAPATDIVVTPFVSAPGLSNYMEGIAKDAKLIDRLGYAPWEGQTFINDLKTKQCPTGFGENLLPNESYGSGFKLGLSNEEIGELRRKLGSVAIFPQVRLVVQYCTGFDKTIHLTV